MLMMIDLFFKWQIRLKIVMMPKSYIIFWRQTTLEWHTHHSTFLMHYSWNRRIKIRLQMRSSIVGYLGKSFLSVPLASYKSLRVSGTKSILAFHFLRFHIWDSYTHEWSLNWLCRLGITASVNKHNYYNEFASFGANISCWRSVGCVQTTAPCIFLSL